MPSRPNPGGSQCTDLPLVEGSFPATSSTTILIMELAFDERVTVLCTERTVARGIAGLIGYVVGKSRESDHADVLNYAVLVDDRERVYMVEPDDLEPTQPAR